MAPVTQTRPEGKPASVEHSKLMVEKVRRDRINRSIKRLRALMNQDGPSTRQPPSRLEKADILELAVGLLRRRALGRVPPSYSQGFSLCLQETLRHLSLRAPLQPAEREEVKLFYVFQRAALQRHVFGEQDQQTAAWKRPARRSPARCHGSLWRPW